jgi:hypothetical protein
VIDLAVNPASEISRWKFPVSATLVAGMDDVLARLSAPLNLIEKFVHLPEPAIGRLWVHQNFKRANPKTDIPP